MLRPLALEALSGQKILTGSIFLTSYSGSTLLTLHFGNNALLKTSDVGSYACQTQKVNSKNITIIYELLVLSVNFFFIEE